MSAEPVPNEVVVLPPAPKVESRLPGAALAAAAAMSVAIRVAATRIMRTGAFLSSLVVPGFPRRSDQTPAAWTCCSNSLAESGARAQAFNSCAGPPALSPAPPQRHICDGHDGTSTLVARRLSGPMALTAGVGWGVALGPTAQGEPPERQWTDGNTDEHELPTTSLSRASR